MIYRSDMKLDPKDLIPFPPLNDFQVGGHFYLLETNGEYRRVVFYESDLRDETHKMMIRHWIFTMQEEKRLFLNRNRPWKTFF